MSGFFSPFRIVLLFITISVVSFFVLPGLQVDLLPKEKSSKILVSFGLPNSSPDIIEQQVTSLLENALSQLTELKSVTSVSNYNNGSITLFFDSRADLPMKVLEAASLIRQVYRQLPAGASYPVISGGNDNNVPQSPLLVYTISAPQQAFEILQTGEEVFKKNFAGKKGFSEVSFSGTPGLQITISFDNERCQALHIQPSQILNSLQSHFSPGYPGTIASKSGEQLFLRIQANAASLEAIENMILTGPSSAFVRVKDIAKVYQEEQEPQSFFRINGRNSVSMSIFARDGENRVIAGKQAKQLVQESRPQLPSRYDVRLEYDDTVFLEKELKKSYRRIGLSLAILTAFILLSYRSWRHLAILLIGLIVNLSLTIILVGALGINVHLYTIAGLAISFGIILDNAIVMLDYYRQYRNKNVFMALLGATSTIIASLLLVFFLPEHQRNNLVDFAAIICASLTASLLVALWFIPGLHVLFFSGMAVKQTVGTGTVRLRKILRGQHLYYSLISRLAGYRNTFICFIILLFGIPVFLLPSEWEGHDWYNNTIGSEYYQKTLRPHVDKWLGGTSRMFEQNVYAHPGAMDNQRTTLHVTAGLPYGNSLEQANNVFKTVEQYLATIDGIDKYVTNIRSGQYGTIEISFKEAYEQGPLPYQLKSQLINRSIEQGGVTWNIYGVGQGFSTAVNENIPSFRLIMKGYHYNELERQSEILAGMLLRHKRIPKVNTNERLVYNQKQSAEYVLQLDRQQMALANVRPSEVLEKITQLSQPVGPSATVTLDNYYYPVVLKEKNAGSYSRHQVLNQPTVLNDDHAMQLSNAAHLDLRTTTNSIHRENRQYIRVISFEYMGAAQLGNKYVQDVLKEMRQQIPVGYTVIIDANYWNWDEKKQQYLLIFLLILIDFLICSILFESLKKPFFIISMIPISFIGIFLTFSLSGFYFDQGGYASFILLGGLVVNAAIFIVNDFSNLRPGKTNYNRLLIKATSNRARTILLTVISSICGLIPFIIEGGNETFWFALAAGSIGGLLFSLFSVFIVLPVFLWKKNQRHT